MLLRLQKTLNKIIMNNYVRSYYNIKLLNECHFETEDNFFLCNFRRFFSCMFSLPLSSVSWGLFLQFPFVGGLQKEFTTLRACVFLQNSSHLDFHVFLLADAGSQKNVPKGLGKVAD